MNTATKVKQKETAWKILVDLCIFIVVPAKKQNKQILFYFPSPSRSVEQTITTPLFTVSETKICDT